MNWVFAFFLTLPVPGYMELIALHSANRGFSFYLVKAVLSAKLCPLRTG